jgi:hypothetical protein
MRFRTGVFIMKVNVQVECTPEEARDFLGLPDVQPMQQAMMSDLEARLRANLQAMDPEVIVKTWLPASIQGVEQMQKMFWSQVQQTFSSVAGSTGALTNIADRRTKDENGNGG